MELCEDLQAFCDAVNAAVDTTMLTDISNLAKSEISNTGRENVYEAYTPRFNSRRGINGSGILDITTMKDSYDYATKTLEIQSFAPFQHLWGGRYPHGHDLTDVVEEGNKNFNMGIAGPRPFYQSAEYSLEKTGSFDKTLESGVNSKIAGRKF